MPLRLSLPAVVTLGAALLVVVAFRYFWRYREEPGGWWWLGVLAGMAVYGFSYGVGLLVFDPGLRWAFEAGRLVGAAVSGPAFLGFALVYTGRDRYRHSWAFRGLVAVMAAWSLLLVTTPYHDLLWTGFRIEPTLGAATVAYSRGPLFFAAALLSWLAIGTGTALLFDTLVSYGPLYRRQALAIALTPIPVGLASGAHILGVDPVGTLDLVPVAFLPHIALDAYALFFGGMFEMTPAARRIGERAALDDLGTAVAVVDDRGQVVKLNDAAERTVGVDRRAALGQPLGDLLGADLDLGDGTTSATVATSEGRREFDVVSSRVEDGAGRHIGHTVVLHDVTDERRRKQRLEVLNRVLRHNLRNDLTAVQGYLEPIAAGEATGDGEDPQALAARAGENLAGLVALGEKAREVDRLVDADRDGATVATADVLRALADELRAAHPDCDLSVDADRAPPARADERTLAAVVRNLVENAVEHSDRDSPRVEVTATRETDGERAWVALSVADDGPGIPAHEREVVLAGEETELEHGSGLGLWLVKWAVAELGGDLSFADNDPRGSVVTVRIPAADGPA